MDHTPPDSDAREPSPGDDSTVTSIVAALTENGPQEQVTMQETVGLIKQQFNDLIEKEQQSLGWQKFLSQIGAFLKVLPALLIVFFTHYTDYVINPQLSMKDKFSFSCFKVIIILSTCIKFAQRFFMPSITARGLELVREFGDEGLTQLQEKGENELRSAQHLGEHIAEHFTSFLGRSGVVRYLILLVLKPLLWLWELFFDPLCFIFLFVCMWEHYGFKNFIVCPLLYLGFVNVFTVFPERTYVGILLLSAGVALYYYKSVYSIPQIVNIEDNLTQSPDNVYAQREDHISKLGGDL